MRLLAFVFIYVVVARANAADFTRDLLRAKNSAQIVRVAARHERLKIARTACKLQLRVEAVPSACYESLRLESESGMHPRKGDRARLLFKLDELCERAAEKLNIPRVDAETSPKCRRFIASAREIRKYREKTPDWSGN